MSKKRNKIVCIGGATIDRKSMLKDWAQLETSNPVTTTVSFGGVARNVAENLARLQCPVALVSVWGHDQEGKVIARQLDELRINREFCQKRRKQRTATYTSIHQPNGEMVIGTADMDILEGMTVSWLKEVWPMIMDASWIFLDTNLPQKSLRWLIRRASKDNVSLCIDPVSVPKAARLPDYLKGVKLLMPNLAEAEAITGIEYDGQSSLEAMWHVLKKSGVKRLAITLGEDGLFAACKDEVRHVSAQTVTVEEVTGAGDALNAGILWALYNNLPFFEACDLGIYNASLTLQTKETVFSELTPEHLLAHAPAQEQGDKEE